MATAEPISDYAEVLQSLKFLNLTTNQNINGNFEEIFETDSSSNEAYSSCRKLHYEMISKRLKFHRFRRRFFPYWYSTAERTSSFDDRKSFSSTKYLSKIVHNDPFYQSDYYRRLNLISGALDADDFDDKPGLLLLLNSNLKRKNSRISSELTCSAQARRPESSASSSNTALTIGELAAYLDEFLYIPKKMSYMAENMYT